MAERRSSWWFWWPVVLCWVLPVVALAAVVPLTEQRRAASVTQEPSATVVVAERAQTLRQSVDIILTLDEPAVARVSDGGVVTSVDVAVGDTIAQGQVLLSMDGTARRAYLGGTPLYRELGLGDSGADVASLHGYLTESGYTGVPTGNVFTGRSARVVREFQKAVGAQADGRFRPGYVIYVPDGASVVGTIMAGVGDRLAADAPVLEGFPRPSNVRVEAADGAPVPVLSAGLPLVLTRGDARLELAAGPWTAQEAAQIFARFRDGVPAAGEAEASAQAELRVSGVHVELQEPRRAGAVPGTAVLTSRDGVRCLFVDDGSAAAAPTAVVLEEAALVVGELGVASVPESLVGKTVVRDPATLSEEVRASCG